MVSLVSSIVNGVVTLATPRVPYMMIHHSVVHNNITVTIMSAKV